MEVVRCHLGPERRNGGLNGRVELVVIHPDQPVTIGHHPIEPVHLGGEQTLHLLDTALMDAALLHHPHQQAEINRQHRNIGARLGHQRLANRHPGVATDLGQLQVDGLGGSMQMLLGITDGAIAIEGIGGFGADVGVGDGLCAGGQTVGLLQCLHPELPILAPHHGDGIADLLRRGGRQ